MWHELRWDSKVKQYLHASSRSLPGSPVLVHRISDEKAQTENKEHEVSYSRSLQCRRRLGQYGDLDSVNDYRVGYHWSRFTRTRVLPAIFAANSPWTETTLMHTERILADIAASATMDIRFLRTFVKSFLVRFGKGSVKDRRMVWSSNASPCFVSSPGEKSLLRVFCEVAVRGCVWC